MIILAALAVAASAGAVSRVPPSSETVTRWYLAALERTRKLTESLAETPIRVVWTRNDTHSYSPAELQDLQAASQRRPLSSARTNLERAETSKRLGGFQGEHELWFGTSGFRHNLDMKYDESNPFVDSVARKGSGWTLTPGAFNQLPATSMPQAPGRGADLLQQSFQQDLLPSFTGALSEVVKRTLEQPAVTLSANRFVIECPSPADKFISSVTITGVWDEASDSGRVASLILNARQGPRDNQSWTFTDWTSEANVVYAKHARREMPTIHTAIAIDIRSVTAVTDAEVERVIAEPNNPGGGQTYVDAVRGTLTLGSRASYKAGAPVAERLSESGAVRVDLLEPDSSNRVERILAWTLGCGTVAAVVGVVWLKRRRALRY